MHYAFTVLENRATNIFDASRQLCQFRLFEWPPCIEAVCVLLCKGENYMEIISKCNLPAMSNNDDVRRNYCDDCVYAYGVK